MNYSYKIPPVDWCLIQYLLGIKLNLKYKSLEDSFKILLKQYILFFDTTTISSRDKKRFLEEFINKYEQLTTQELEIDEILNKYMTIPCYDIFLVLIFKISIFNLINDYPYEFNVYNNFATISNFQLKNFFAALMKNIMEDKFNNKLNNIPMEESESQDDESKDDDESENDDKSDEDDGSEDQNQDNGSEDQNQDNGSEEENDDNY
jgi:hypothetical protein